MPNITFYSGNKHYIAFLQLTDEERKGIRERLKELFEKEVNGNESKYNNIGQ